jgi:hypothetical protein
MSIPLVAPQIARLTGKLPAGSGYRPVAAQNKFVTLSNALSYEFLRSIRGHADRRRRPHMVLVNKPWSWPYKAYSAAMPVRTLLITAIVFMSAGLPLRASESSIVGSLIDDIAVIDASGTATSLAAISAGKVLVVASFSCNCPISKRYAPRLVEIERRYRESVAFALLGTGNETAEELRAAIAQYGFEMPVIDGRDRNLARTLRIRTTTDTYVLDRERRVKYRGAIDDGHGLTHHKDPDHNYLIDALDAVVAGKSPEVTQTAAPGCEVELGDDVAPAPVVWSKDICPILQEHCQKCHRPNGGGPFSLLTYDDVVVNDPSLPKTIKREVKERRMPPWYADPAVGGPWANDHSLSKEKIAKITAWVDAGCPQGDVADEPPQRTWTSEWEIGTPDVIIQDTKSISIPAQGTLPYMYATIETHFTEDKWVQAVEMRPGEPELVHHAQAFLAMHGNELSSEKTPVNGGRADCYFAAMAPGQTSQVYPPGTAKFVPKGAQLILEIHYVPDGTARTDQMRVGMIFAKEKPTYAVNSFDIRNGQLDIAPGQSDYAASAQFALPKKARLLALQPHMHWRGKSFLVEIIMPDKSVLPFLSVPEYNFDWQLSYVPAKPVDLPKGAIIRVTGHFDNSAENKRLTEADRAQRVRAGANTTDEMLVGFGEWHELPE